MAGVDLGDDFTPVGDLAVGWNVVDDSTERPRELRLSACIADGVQTPAALDALRRVFMVL
jgi:hypothetical protein